MDAWQLRVQFRSGLGFSAGDSRLSRERARKSRLPPQKPRNAAAGMRLNRMHRHDGGTEALLNS